MKSRVWEPRGARNQSRLFESVVPAHHSSVSATGPPSPSSSSWGSEGSGLAGGKEQPWAKLQIPTAFTVLLQADSKTRNPPETRTHQEVCSQLWDRRFISLPPGAWVLYPGLGFCILLPLSDSQVPTVVINIPLALLEEVSRSASARAGARSRLERAIPLCRVAPGPPSPNVLADPAPCQTSYRKPGWHRAGRWLSIL